MSQKAENLLNLALDATSEEREKSLELEVGYQPLDQEWDLIIKYSGNLEAVREIASSVTGLSNEYAILTVPESRIRVFRAIRQRGIFWERNIHRNRSMQLCQSR